jgi:membrane protein
MSNKITNWIKNSMLVKWTSKILLGIKPPGFEGMNLYDLTVFLTRSFKEGDYAIRAAAISFNLILSIFPLLLVILALIPYLPISGFQASVLAEIKLFIPDNMNELIIPTLEDLILEKHYFVLSIGFILTIYYASNSINTILRSFNSSFQIDLKRHPIKQRLIALSLSLVWAFLSLGAIVLMILGEDLIILMQESLSINETITYYLGHGIKWVVVFFMLILGITILYNFGNPEMKKFKFISAGSSLAALVIILASVGFITYATNFGNYNELYGSLGSLIVLLLWINLCSRILLIGFELTTKIDAVRRVNPDATEISVTNPS